MITHKANQNKPSRSHPKMGRKKRTVEKEYIFCFYCDKEFDNENTLKTHQVARHFRCEECKRKLAAFPGLAKHCELVHKTKIKSYVPRFVLSAVLTYDVLRQSPTRPEGAK